MTFSFFDVIVLIGILQSFIIGGLLFTHKPTGTSQVLPWVLLVTGLLNCKILLHTLGLWNTPVFRYFPLALDLVIQPLFYLYIISITQAQRKLGKFALIHLIPATLFMAHALLVYSQVLPMVDLTGKARIAAYYYYNQVKEVEDYLSVISFLLYFYLSFRNLLIYRHWVNEAISDASYPTYNWLRNLLLFMGGVTALLFINVVLDYGFDFGRTTFLHWQFFYFFLTVTIYYMGFKGYRQTVSPRLPPALGKPNKEQAEVIPLPQVQQNSVAIRQLLEEEKMYRNSTLTITQLAKQLDLRVNVVSYTISKAFGKSFRDLINEYRVEEVKNKLGDPAFSHLSILGIALDSGFNSEASFYRVFKKYTNVSPKEYQFMNR